MEIITQRIGCDQRLIDAANQPALKNGVIEASEGRPDKVVVLSNFGYTKKKEEGTLIAVMPADRIFSCKVGFQLHPGNVQAMSTRCIRMIKYDSNQLADEYHFLDFYSHKTGDFERRIADFNETERLHQIVADFLLKAVIPPM